MTILLDNPVTEPIAHPVWQSPNADLWVSSADGSYRGMIERSGSGWVAHDHHGKTVGEFDSLTRARVAVDTWVADTGSSHETVILKVVSLTALVCSGIAAFVLIH
jgi:hypothetical protein